MIDLYAMSCVLSRASHAIETRGEESANRDIWLAKAFVRKARRRVAENYRRIEKNDDEVERQIARAFFDKNGYPAHCLFLDE